MEEISELIGTAEEAKKGNESCEFWWGASSDDDSCSHGDGDSTSNGSAWIPNTSDDLKDECEEHTTGVLASIHSEASSLGNHKISEDSDPEESGDFDDHCQQGTPNNDIILQFPTLNINHDEKSVVSALGTWATSMTADYVRREPRQLTPFEFMTQPFAGVVVAECGTQVPVSNYRPSSLGYFAVGLSEDDLKQQSGEKIPLAISTSSTKSSSSDDDETIGSRGRSGSE